MESNTLNFYLVKVDFTNTNEDTGKTKISKSQYLVDAMSCTEAEARTNTYLKGTMMDYKITATIESPIEDVVLTTDKLVSKLDSLKVASVN